MARRRKPEKYKFALRPEVARWLDANDDDDAEADAFFDDWLEEVEDDPRLLTAGKVKVDPAVLHTRFACVPERCAPWNERGRMRSCCADIFVPLTPAERRRLRRHRRLLAGHLLRTEPRLRDCLAKPGREPGDFFLDEDGDALERVGGRCIFSRRDAQGRIRCRLYTIAGKLGLETTDIQPYTCRIFPLVLVQLERGRVLLTVLHKDNYRGLESLPPWRFPCLADPGLPPLHRSMAGTLDWLFGRGFAAWLARQAG